MKEYQTDKNILILYTVSPERASINSTGRSPVNNNTTRDRKPCKGGILFTSDYKTSNI